MQKKIFVDANNTNDIRVVVYENNLIQEYDDEAAIRKQIKGNIYLAKVTRVEPSLQAAFIDYGAEKHGFLPFAEIHPDYYQIPLADRQGTSEESSDTNDYEREDIRYQVRAITPPEYSNEDENEELESTTDIVANDDNSSDKNIDTNFSDNNILQDEDFSQSEEIIDNKVSDSIEEELEESRNNVRNTLYKQYKIQDVIKRNQVILVQVIKEERGNKGASFTSYISLAGRYCVLMPNAARQGGVSRKINNFEDRKRLKLIIDDLSIPDGSSVIIRTAGSNKTKIAIRRDYNYLVRLWNSIRETTLTATTPAFIHAEGDLIKRTIRDLYDDSISEILIHGEQVYKTAKDFMKIIIPSHTNKVKQYKGKSPIFCRYNIEEQIASLYNPVVQLSSGGYLVINHTEALIAIDVNSGKSTSERNIEETAFKTNIEAAYEIARQLRLRDLSGLIVIDFIDMVELRNRRLVEKAFKESLQFDRARIQVSMISSLGLLEMSRQRLKPSFMEINTTKCEACNGKGSVRTVNAQTEMILRTIENEVYKGSFSDAINVYAHFDVISYILNHKRNDVLKIEKQYSLKIYFKVDIAILNTPDSFSIEKVDLSLSRESTIPISIAPEYGNITDEENYQEEYMPTTPENMENHRTSSHEHYSNKKFKRGNFDNRKRSRDLGKPPLNKKKISRSHSKFNHYDKRNEFSRNHTNKSSNVPEKSAGGLLKSLWNKITSS
ncbi:Ribonuclease E [Rickettsiales bacterium Ac37b]|nr:Ribonuclease E [Rickettsiales bacterium Ac37b]